MWYIITMWDIKFYEKENGETPAKDFIDDLDITTQTKIFFVLDLLETEGNRVREPYTKPLLDGIFEIRVKTDKAVRVLYFFKSGKKIILTNGFVKKTQKTPANEIDKAIKYKKDYERRSN